MTTSGHYSQNRVEGQLVVRAMLGDLCLGQPNRNFTDQKSRAYTDFGVLVAEWST